MSNQEWPASAYAIGSFIQATVARPYLKALDIKPADDVLDIGCGNGAFSVEILERFPMNALLGIDASENMLALAEKAFKPYPYASVQKADVITMQFETEFDWIVSFWCLQWVNCIEVAFKNIDKALKSGGQFLVLLPTGDDPFMSAFEAVKSSGQFPVLEAFKPPVNYKKLHDLDVVLNTLAFKTLKIERQSQILILPSLDIFRKFVHGIAFFQGQVPEREIAAINEAMVESFDSVCEADYQGQKRFSFTVLYIKGEK